MMIFHTSAVINGLLASRTFASIKNHMMCCIFMSSWFESHNIIGVGFIQFHGRTQICLRIARPEKMQYKFELKDIIIRGVGTGWEGWAFPLPVFGRPETIFFK